MAGYRSGMSAGKPLAIDWYDTPRWYDIVFDVDTRREADFLEEMLRRHGPERRGAKPARVLEPACGSGRLVCEMARRGHAVLGFDINAAMLAFAKKKLAARGLEARVRVDAMESFQCSARFELAHCLVSTFKYLLDEASARAHLECVARALVPGGVFVLGFHLSDYARTSASQERWVATRRGTTVTCTTRVAPANRRKRLEDVRTRLSVVRAGGVIRTETCWRFRTYDAREARRLIASVPELESVALYDFHYEADRPRSIDDGILDCVFVLRKRSGPARPINR